MYTACFIAEFVYTLLLSKTVCVMAVFTLSADCWVIGRLTDRYHSVMAGKACSDDCVMINCDTCPACCIRVTTLAGVEARDMVCRFSGCSSAVMTGET
jgi:hypothetical protein